MQQPAKLGMTLFLTAESVFFFMLVMAFVIFRRQSVRVAAETLNFPLTSVYTACLLGSSLTMWRASRTASRRIWTAATILLGLVFLGGQGSEYLRILHHGATGNQDLFETTFFTLAGVHGFHVVIGILLLMVGPRTQSVGAFWHFVVGAWLVIFGVVYVWTFL